MIFISILSQTSKIFAKGRCKLPDINTSFNTRFVCFCPARFWSDENWHSRTMSVLCEINLICNILYSYWIFWTKSLNYIFISRVAFIPFFLPFFFFSALMTPVILHYWILLYEYFTVKQNQLHILFKRLSWGHVAKMVKLLSIRNDWFSKDWTVT